MLQTTWKYLETEAFFDTRSMRKITGGLSAETVKCAAARLFFPLAACDSSRITKYIFWVHHSGLPEA